jgi:DNA replication protein DnaC
MSEPLERALALGFHGLVLNFNEVADQPWVMWLLNVEEGERRKRSLERRVTAARLGQFKPMADFDWTWPKSVDRAQIQDLLGLSFVQESLNVVLMGPNAVGKTMIAKNLAHRALLQGHSVLCTSAATMLNELAAEDSASALERRLRRLCRPNILFIDEVGYLSYGDRHADLLFEVVTRRYELHRPIIITTNKPFREWGEVFPNATTVVTLVDRLVHRSEVVHIDARSYRLKEANERKKQKGRGSSSVDWESAVTDGDD